MRQTVATITQVAGAAAVSTGGFFVSPAAGFILAGVSALVFGIALERG